MFATYVHHLDPVLLQVYGKLALRWYGLAYLMGFAGGFYLLRHLAQRKLWVLAPEKTGDFIAMAALLGVFLGGRVGYVLLYSNGGLLAIDPNAWQEALQHTPLGVLQIWKYLGLNASWWEVVKNDPLMVLRVWEGGMASHGGIFGLLVFTWFYAKKHQVTWTGLGDGLCVVAPVGLFFGRMANFINGELFGRVTSGVSWAVKFPLSLAQESEEIQRLAWNACIQVDPKVADATSLEDLISATRHNPELRQTLGEFLPTRHPSQIYEALLEGLLLFAILWWVRTRFPKAPDGLLTGLFFALYALFRIFGEQYREPDAPMVSFLTMGQFFSLFMFIFAAGFFAHAWRGWKKNAVSAE